MKFDPERFARLQSGYDPDMLEPITEYPRRGRMLTPFAAGVFIAALLAGVCLWMLG